MSIFKIRHYSYCFIITFYKIILAIAGKVKQQPSILTQMIAEAHEIREKQSAHKAHVINNIAIKNENQAEDSVSFKIISLKNKLKG